MKILACIVLNKQWIYIYANGNVYFAFLSFCDLYISGKPNCILFSALSIDVSIPKIWSNLLSEYVKKFRTNKYILGTVLTRLKNIQQWSERIYAMVSSESFHSRIV